MEQLTIQQNEPIKSCAFTGHRTLDKDFSQKLLKKYVLALIDDGVENFYTGMAMGFDLLAAETVLACKKKFPQVKLIACIPYYGQEQNFSGKDKGRYASILKKADEKVLLSETYTRNCFLERNRYMCDRADVLVAYLRKEEGGTAYTVRYFKKIKPLKRIVYI
ncbi:MAG: DUF1273 family protein [Clostridia bacterium]|nr:DUF1273 family protein [Clostridia bacterium]